MQVQIDFNTIALIVLALIQLYNTWLTRKTEKNTNSMKDALVAATDKSARAEGVAAGLEQGREENSPTKVEIVNMPTSIQDPTK